MYNIKKLTLFGTTALLLMACGEIEPRTDEGEVGTEEDIGVVETQEEVEHTREDEGEYAEDARHVFGENFEKILVSGEDKPSGEIYVSYREELSRDEVEGIVNNQIKEYLYKMKENDLSHVSIYIYSPLETSYEVYDKEIIAEVTVDRSDLDNLDIESVNYENIEDKVLIWWENPHIKGDEKYTGEDEREFLEEFILEMLKGSMESSTIEFNRELKAYKINPLDESITLGGILAMEGNLEAKEAWGDLVQSHVKLSETVQETLGDGYSIALINPSNTDKYLIIIKDGSIVYNIVEDET